MHFFLKSQWGKCWQIIAQTGITSMTNRLQISTADARYSAETTSLNQGRVLDFQLAYQARLVAQVLHL
jgi:hypothetical protein